MKDLIVRYDSGVSQRIKQIVAGLVAAKQLDGGARPAYVRNVSAVKTLPPIIYPGKSLNAAANYYGHAGETGTPEEQKKEADARRKDRGAPYLFLKAMEGAVIGDGDDILMPRGRERVDWECELAVVIGKKAKYVSAAEAKDYIFGYTIELDMSDRGGRPEKEPRFGGSDWFIGKSHDTFAPMGPWIVPKEFYRDPMNVGQKLTVNGNVMQDSRSTDMIHNIYDLIEYSTSILTMFPGDVIASGSPAGTGMSRSVRPEQIWLKPGDKIVASIEGIGTMTHSVKADPGPAPKKIWTDPPKTEARRSRAAFQGRQAEQRNVGRSPLGRQAESAECRRSFQGRPLFLFGQCFGDVPVRRGFLSPLCSFSRLSSSMSTLSAAAPSRCCAK